MATYFDVIPEEVISLILLKVDKLQPVYDSKVAMSVLTDANFWALKIHQGMPEIDITFARKLYMSFSGQSFMILSYPELLFAVRDSSYPCLEASYNSAVHTVNYCSSNSFPINRIARIDVFISLIPDDSIKLILKEVRIEDQGRYRISLDFSRSRECTFTLIVNGVDTISRPISRKEAIYLLMC